MGNGAVKTIVMLMVLVVLSFVIGAQISDSVRNSFGAFAIIGAVVGGGFMIFMGARVWQLLFILPPFVELLPLGYLSHPITPCGFAPFALSAVIMVYWVVLWSMGRARIRWRWAALFDIPFLVFVGFNVVAFIRHPVALNVMNLDYDAVGGEEVLVLLFVITHYICLSMIPVTKQELEKCLDLSFKLFIPASVLGIILGMARGTTISTEGAAVTRFFLFYPLGSTLFFWAYSKYSVGEMLTSLRCWAITVFAGTATLLTGQRQCMAMFAMAIVFIACIKREVTVLILALAAAYLGVLYLGEMNLLTHMPGSVQRTLVAVPGVKVDENMQRSGAATMNTRYAVWEYAMNPRTSGVKDYIWGDGFAISRAEMNRQLVGGMRRGLSGTSEAEGFTRTRNFHNAAIHTIVRIGYVGLAWCALMCIVAWAVCIQVLRVWYRTKTYPYIVLGFINIPIMLLTYGYANYVTKDFMFSLQSFFFLKLCYCVARDNGLLHPLFASQRYQPLMIREQEQNRTALSM